MLFNIFNNTNKEGHLSFKDHIEKVKQIRKQQAESGKADVDGQIELDEIKAPKFIDNTYNAGKNQKGKVGTIILLEKNETNRCELNLVKLSIDAEEEKTKSESKERTIFILNGIGEITIDGESAEVKTGDVL